MVKINSISVFRRELKILLKKYQSLEVEFAQLLLEIKQNPTKGKPIGKNCYKIRLRIKSKNSGTRGGARIITYVQVIEEVVTLLTIYDKSEKENIDSRELQKRIAEIED